MECGFYHSDTGYWQTLIEPSQHELDMYPSGTISVPVKPSSDHVWQNNGWVYVPSPELTAEELRAQMPRKSMVELRAILRKIKTPVYREGIYAADINAMINQIADLDLQEEARDYFNLGQYAERINPWVDIFGNLAGLSPDEIDLTWVK